MSEESTMRGWLRSRPARALAGAGLLAASFAVAILFAEFAVRLAAPQQLIQIRPDLWQPAESVGYLHRPDTVALMNTGERTVTVRTDRDGFRVGESGRKSAATQVLLLGDSFMEALQVEHEQTTAALLERALEQGLGRPIAVRNAGVVGWDPNHYLIRARSLLARETFSLVVVAVYAGNDAVEQRRPYIPPRVPVERKRFRLPREPRGQDVVDALIAPINDALETTSHLFVLAKNQASILRMRVGLTADYFPVEFKKSEAGSTRWSVTADVLKELDASASARGTQTLFVLIPAPFQVYSSDFNAHLRGFGIDPSTVEIDQPTSRLEVEMQSRGLLTLNVLPAFRLVSGSIPRLYGRVDTHFSPEGHRQLTSILAPTAISLLR